MVINVVFPLLRGQSGVKFPGQFLKNGCTKTNTLNTVCSTAWDTHYIKKWVQSVHSSRSYSKNKVPYQITLEERYTTFRAKIDQQNIRKRYIKYTYSESTLDGLFKTLIFLTHFKASRCQNDGGGGVTRWWQPLLALKSRASLLANFSKTAEQKTTPLIQFEALLEIRILKNVPNRCILRGVIAKIRYRTNWPQKRDTPYSWNGV